MRTTSYTYAAEYHCIGCTRVATAWQRDNTDCELDDNSVPIEWRDTAGNTVQPVCSTDELPTRLGDTFGDGMQWHEPQEFFTCSTCQQEFSLLTGDLKCTSK
jgi:hypothetical protein